MNEASAFERSLRETPDDLAGWCAFADYLVEQGDPRGEFMQTQIALEEESRAKEERDELKECEEELLAEHEDEWLGDLAPLLQDRDGVEYWWGRGFVTELKAQYLTVPLAAAVAAAHATRFLRKLHIEGSRRAAASSDQATLFPTTRVPTPPGQESHEAYFELIGSPCLESVRVFQVGADDEPSPDAWMERCMEARGLEHVAAAMPRVEELYLHCHGYDAAALFALPNLTRLQVLRIYGLGEHRNGYEVPLAALARNAALGSLTHLFVHPLSWLPGSALPLSQVRELINSPHLKSLSHLQLRLSDMGDEGIRAIIESDVLKRLGRLDLRNGAITDAGARLLAGYAPTRELRRLDLSRNRGTSVGLGLLTGAGVKAVVDNSLSRREREAYDAQVRAMRGGHHDPDGDGDEFDME